MFCFGLDEPIGHSDSLLRHSIVWFGDSHEDGQLGLTDKHPISEAVAKLVGHFRFNGRWVLSRCRGRMHLSQSKILQARLRGAGWSLLEDCSQCILATKGLTDGDIWPFAGTPGIPRVPPEVLVLGYTDPVVLDCEIEESKPRAVRGERMVLSSELTSSLAASGGYAVCFGRTHANNRPGISLIGRRGLDFPGILLSWGCKEIFHGADAERAWTAFS